MGFGHRVYKNYDPRAKLIKRVADDVFAQTGVDPKLEIALELERIALEDDYFVSRKLYPNVDFYSGIIYRAMGYPTDYFTVLFALGRLPGLARAVGGDALRPRAEDRAPAAGLHGLRRARVRPAGSSAAELRPRATDVAFRPRPGARHRDTSLSNSLVRNTDHQAGLPRLWAKQDMAWCLAPGHGAWRLVRWAKECGQLIALGLRERTLEGVERRL